METGKMSQKIIYKEEMRDPRDLIPYSKNPRINRDGVWSVKESIEQHGFSNPIIINTENIVCCGHTRLAAALEAGLVSVPCRVREMSEKEFISLNLADNKTNEITSWSNKKLEANLRILGELDAHKVPGFEASEINKYFGFDDDEGIAVPDDDVELEVIRSISFKFGENDYDLVSDKLKAVKKAHKLNNLNEVLLKVLENFKGTDRVIIKKGAVSE